MDRSNYSEELFELARQQKPLARCQHCAVELVELPDGTPVHYTPAQPNHGSFECIDTYGQP